MFLKIIEKRSILQFDVQLNKYKNKPIQLARTKITVSQKKDNFRTNLRANIKQSFIIYLWGH